MTNACASKTNLLVDGVTSIFYTIEGSRTNTSFGHFLTSPFLLHSRKDTKLRNNTAVCLNKIINLKNNRA